MTYLMNIQSGEVQKESDWLNDYNNMTAEEWGSKEFNNGGLVEVIYKNGEWVEEDEE